MKTRILTALLALALPLGAQDASDTNAEAMFYKAFYLEKGARDFAGAMALYDKFLAAAPDHKLAKQAAKQQFGLLNRTGKTKERDAFREKYAALLGNAADVARPAGDAPAGRSERGGRGERGGERGGRGGFGGRGGNMEERIAEMEKRLAAAKEAGDEEQVQRLTRTIERMKQGGDRGGDRGGRGGRGGERGGRGGFGGRRGGIFGDTKLADMTDEQLDEFKAGLDRMAEMMDRMRDRLGEERAKAFETNLEKLKQGLKDGKLEDAQKALDTLRQSMGRGRGGRGGF